MRTSALPEIPLSDEQRRILALSLAVEHSPVDLPFETVVKAAGAFETFLKGEVTA